MPGVCPSPSPGSGLIMMPTKPSSLTHRSSSSRLFFGLTPPPPACRRPADAAKAAGLELHLESDRVVDRLAVPADDLLGLHRVHHRIRPRRDERPVGSDFL